MDANEDARGCSVNMHTIHKSKDDMVGDGRNGRVSRCPCLGWTRLERGSAMHNGHCGVGQAKRASM